jgi:5-methylcytosine-specific restriction endonuclease McrA
MSKHHLTPEYQREARAVRKILGPQIAAGNDVRCVNCGHPVQAGQRWDVGHIIDASRGGAAHRTNMGAAHTRCNRSAGGRAGAAKTNTTSKAARRLPAW